MKMIVVEVRNFYYFYNGIEVLKGINLKIEDGEFVVIFGLNGVGKSILLKCFFGIFRCNGVYILGWLIGEYFRNELVRFVVYIL